MTELGNLVLEIQRAIDSNEAVPTDAEFLSAGALAWQLPSAEVCLRIVDTSEMQQLNKTFRDKDQPTNVLAFPAETPEELTGLADLPAGDVVICASVVATEAQAQNKLERHHWMHLWVHGLLHLQGYDHIEEQDAVRMEECERQILGKMGIEDPYVVRENQPL